jgi:DNA-binding FadR family transcriptional regulator
MARDPEKAEAAVRAHMKAVGDAWRESDSETMRIQTAERRLQQHKARR